MYCMSCFAKATEVVYLNVRLSAFRESKQKRIGLCPLGVSDTKQPQPKAFYFSKIFNPRFNQTINSTVLSKNITSVPFLVFSLLPHIIGLLSNLLLSSGYGLIQGGRAMSQGNRVTGGFIVFHRGFVLGT